MDHATPVCNKINGPARPTSKSYLPKLSAAILLLVFVFAIQFSGMAQSMPPASNISGPISAKVSGHDIILHVTIAHSTPNPDLKYSFESNTSGAVIKKTEPAKFNAATNTVTQEVVVTPGTSVGGFKLHVEAANANGKAHSSISVSVDNQ
jgi:hypothetical protein